MIELLDVKNVSDERKQQLLEFIDECRDRIERGEINAAFFIVQEAVDSGWKCHQSSDQPAAFMIGALEMLKLSYALEAVS